jgi:branched-chain amino acid transport system substrate-binding protein
VNKFVALPLISTLVSAMIVGRIANTLIGDNTYHVYVVGDRTDKSVRDMMDAANDGTFNVQFGTTTVKTEVLNDSGDPQQAELIAQQLVAKPDTLMVIGHVFSSSTKRALPVYMRAAPPIPVILTTETNPTLLQGVQVPPVFRLFPTDEDQAKTAAEFLDSQHAKSVWVIADVSNPTYSDYLTKQFLSEAYRHPSLKIVLWSNSLNLPPYAVDKLGIDWVFYAGEWQSALVLVRQLRAMQAMPGAHLPNVLVSDASADKQLLDHGKTDVEGIYLLHPMTANSFTDHEYRAVGKEAHDLTARILEDVHDQFDDLASAAAPVGYRLRQLLGLRRVSDARRAVAEYMVTAINKRKLFSLPDGGGDLTMGTDEEHPVFRVNASFHIWKIADGKFKELDEWDEKAR